MKSIKYILTLFTLLWAGVASAQIVGVSAWSWHEKSTYGDGIKYRESTPGIYGVTESGLTGAVFKNSHNRTSVAVGQSVNYNIADWFALSATAGLVSGYPMAEVVPFLVTGARIGPDKGPAARVSAGWRWRERVDTAVINFSVQYGF